MSNRFINIADLKNPETGLIYREENNAKQHAYSVGQPVKLDNEEWVKITGLTRDCDGTPLYSYESHGLSEDSIIGSLEV